MEKTGCKIICGAPTTLAVKGLMVMMMEKRYDMIEFGRPEDEPSSIVGQRGLTGYRGSKESCA